MKHLILFLIVSSVLTLGAAEKMIVWDLQKNRNDGKNGPIQLEKTENGLKITVSRKEKFWGGVYFDHAEAIDMNQYNTFILKVIPGKGAEEYLNQIGFAVYGKKGWGSRRLAFRKQEDGSWISKWSLPKDGLQANYQFDSSTLFRIRISFPHEKLPDGKTFDFTVVSIESSSENGKADSGDAGKNGMI